MDLQPSNIAELGARGPDSPSRDDRGFRRQARAIGVAVHVGVVVLSAIPSPEGGLNRANWNEATVQAEIAPWAQRFEMPQGAFTDRLYTVARSYQDALDVVLTPVRVYERWTGTAQSWKMFVAADRWPKKLQVQIHGDGPWETLYEARSEDATWMRGALDTERARASIFRWSWPAYRTTYADGCNALARVAFAARSEARELRCRFWKQRTASPEEVDAGRTPNGAWTNVVTVKRADVAEVVP